MRPMRYTLSACRVRPPSPCRGSPPAASAGASRPWHRPSPAPAHHPQRRRITLRRRTGQHPQQRQQSPLSRLPPALQSGCSCIRQASEPRHSSRGVLRSDQAAGRQLGRRSMPTAPGQRWSISIARQRLGGAETRHQVLHLRRQPLSQANTTSNLTSNFIAAVVMTTFLRSQIPQSSWVTGAPDLKL